MVRFRHCTEAFVRDRPADAVAYRLVGLPVAAGGERVAVRAVGRLTLRVPIAAVRTRAISVGLTR